MDKGKKLADLMYGQRMDEGGAAFGVFPQMKPRRSKQDPEAAKDVPRQLLRGWAAGTLGLPGDIEGLIRMLPGLDETPRLPTSEFYLDYLPGKAQSPAGEAAAGMGTLFGGLGSTKVARGALKAGEAAGKAGRAALETVGTGPSPGGLAAQRGVVKMPGGNWINDLVSRDLKPLRKEDVTKERVEGLRQASQDERVSPTARQDLAASYEQGVKDLALNNWVDSNLANYVKKQMGSPDDPVRKLAEQGILHMKLEGEPVTSYVLQQRVKEGFPREGMGQSRLAQDWEALSDDAIRYREARKLQKAGKLLPEVQKAERAMKDKELDVARRFDEQIRSAGTLGEKEIQTLNERTPIHLKAQALLDTEYPYLSDTYRSLRSELNTADWKDFTSNPWIEKLDPKTKIYDAGTYELGFDHIIDVLRQDLAAGRIRPEQLNKVSMEQAVRRTYEYDQEMAKKMAEAQIKATEGMPVYKEYPEGYRWIELKKPTREAPEGFVKDPVSGYYDHPDGRVLDLELEGRKALEDALKYEGETMGHCVGGYCPDVEAGRSRIFSLRDAKGEPHVTVEVQPIAPDWQGVKKAGGDPSAIMTEAKRRMGIDTPENEAELLRSMNGDQRYNLQKELDRHFADVFKEQFGDISPNIVQIKGKQNRAPKEEYLPYVQDFVRSGQWSDVGDIRNTGLVRRMDLPHDERHLFPQDSDYITMEELRKLREGKDSGMKRGGPVRFTNNPDAMRLELEKPAIKPISKAAGGVITADDLIIEERPL